MVAMTASHLFMGVSIGLMLIVLGLVPPYFHDLVALVEKLQDEIHSHSTFRPPVRSDPADYPPPVSVAITGAALIALTVVGFIAG